MTLKANEQKYWLAFGDIHENLSALYKIPDLEKYSGIIVHGDLTNEGNAKKIEKIITTLEETGLPVLAQVGNMDLLEANDWLERKNINLHTHFRELSPEIAIFGIGGSTFTPMHTPTEFSEENYAEWLEHLWSKAKNYPYKILVSHNPPQNTHCDDLGNGTHVGSSAVREFIEKHQPDVCICGHIHEAMGTDRIGKTKIINPGLFQEGGYIRICLENAALDAELKHI